MEPSTSDRILDLISTVRELHGLNPHELHKLLKDAETSTVHVNTVNDSLVKVDVEKLAGFLPLHLLAVLISSDRDESFFHYMLSGVRLLHSLCDLAHRHMRLEQVLLDDVKMSEQLLDLVIYLLIVLAGCRQDGHDFQSFPLLHSAMTACSLHLLTVCVSSQWQELVQVLLAHPKVDIFMDAAFGAVLRAMNFLHLKITTSDRDQRIQIDEQIVSYLSLQCEASLQFLLSLCQQKMFRERLLRIKELCGKGGILFLVQATLKLNVASQLFESPLIFASISRLKAKILAVLLHLCEAESISYLDEVASSPRCFNLAKSVALEVLQLIKSAVINPSRIVNSRSDQIFAMGLLHLNALRLADIFSDDSNFRSYITTSFTRVLTAIFSLPHGEFLSTWCSSELPLKEEDASLEYDTFTSAGWILDTRSDLNLPDAIEADFNLVPSSMPPATYAHQRTSLFVKVIANLHCFVPNICEEQERNLFLHKFLECMRMDPSKSLPGFNFASGSAMAATLCRNLRSLLRHAESLIPNFLNEEDVQLLRVFFNQLQSLINPSDFVEVVNQTQDENVESLGQFAENYINDHQQEAQSMGFSGEPLNDNNSNLHEGTPEANVFYDEDPAKCFVDPVCQDARVSEIKDKCDENVSDDADRNIQNAETSGAGSSSTRMEVDDPISNCKESKSSEIVKEHCSKGADADEKTDSVQFEEKQPRKRKRTIMNEYQMMLVENALLDEPDMQRHAASLQSWARKLSLHGSEVTSLQLKNWLNNRKARLARAGKDSNIAVEADKGFHDKELSLTTRGLEESPESHGEDTALSHAGYGENGSKIGFPESSEAVCGLDSTNCKPGQTVMLLDAQGGEIGKGKLHQVHGKWYGKSLEEMGTFVVDVSDLKVESYASLPYPSEVTGTSFSEAKIKIGAMRVLWNPNKLVIWRRQISPDRDLNN